MTTTAFVDGSTLSAAAWANDVDTATYNRLTGVAGTNTITAGGPASMTAYAAGQMFSFVPVNTNSGASTLNITPSGGAALGAKNIFMNGAACTGGEIRVSVPAQVWYDGTQFNLMGMMTAGSIPGSISVGGAITAGSGVTGTVLTGTTGLGVGVASAEGRFNANGSGLDAVPVAGRSFRVLDNTQASVRFSVNENGTASVGAANATGATTGHFSIPTSAGAPTGVPSGLAAGTVAIQYDTTNNKLYVYNGAWKSTAALT